MPAAVKSNMASKRGVTAGCGFVGSIGIRYRYTEPKGKRPKHASVASDRQATYARILSAAQSICNVMCLIARHFGDDMFLELSQIREFVKKVVGVNGLEWHCIFLVSDRQHQNKWSICIITTKTSVALERRSGQACSMEASPSHATSDVSTYTQVNRNSSVTLIITLIIIGDMAVFDGAKNYHANMVIPCDIEQAANLPSELQNAIVCLYVQSQQ